MVHINLANLGDTRPYNHGMTNYTKRDLPVEFYALRVVRAYIF